MRTGKDVPFISDGEIRDSLETAKALKNDRAAVGAILEKAKQAKGLTHREAAVLLEIDDPDLERKLFRAAREVKFRIYGNRIVLFAPLYVSNYCVNECAYCGYKHSNDSFPRKRLSMQELAREVEILESMGHKRLALEAGEDPVNCDLAYILDCIRTIYGLKFANGSIRRINVNIAATTVENYRRLAEAEIGTYILFQETYHRPTYEVLHRKGPKRDYAWHTEAMDRAMEGGIEDVGLGVLYGLYDYKYDTVAMLMHAEHLEAKFGVGPHTVSVPRLRPAEGVTPEVYPHLVNDDAFRRIVAVLRLSVPYAGMILSTREEPEFRDQVIDLGISQISAGSSTGVGGYCRDHAGLAAEAGEDKPQFEVGDHRSPREVLKSLCAKGYLPSYCTACYREGRTGDRFMALAKSGQIANICGPNAIVTFKEYLQDYGDDELREIGERAIRENLEQIPRQAARRLTEDMLARIEKGERDLRI
jgi:2-iminoacetate synthase